MSEVEQASSESGDQAAGKEEIARARPGKVHTRTHTHLTALNTRHSSPCDFPLTFAVHTVPHRLQISTSGHKECVLISVETDSYAYSAASFRSHIKLANSKLFAKPRSQHLYVLGVVRIGSPFTRVGTLIVATIYLQLIQNTYMFRSFTVLQCSHQHCVQPAASDVEVVGYL